MKRIVMMAALSMMGAMGTAEAANNTIGTAVQTVVGEKRSQVLVATDVAYFGIALSTDRSYVAFCWEPLLESQGAFSGFCHVDIRNDADVVVSTLIGSEPRPKAGEAATFTPTSVNNFFVKITNSGAFGSGTQTVNLLVLETTLASPWFFVSTSSGYDGFATIRNQSTTSLSVTARAYSAAGALLGSTTVSIPANGNTVVLASSLGATSSGSMTITHNGMLGSIVANTTTLSGATGLSFDAPFSTRVTWSMF